MPNVPTVEYLTVIVTVNNLSTKWKDITMNHAKWIINNTVIPALTIIISLWLVASTVAVLNNLYGMIR